MMTHQYKLFINILERHNLKNIKTLDAQLKTDSDAYFNKINDFKPN